MSWMTDNADQLREQAQVRRNRGQHVGKSAKGWDVKRPDPTDDLELLRSRLKAVFHDHWLGVAADYEWNKLPDDCKIPF